jgi:CubicO group peptidase (beta-lactamase class C family)
LSKHLDFQFESDPVIGERAKIRDALSHSTGIAQLDLSWYGASGKNLVGPSDVLHAVTHLLVVMEVRSSWSYCNYMYVLLANIITVTSGASWTSFLQRRLLQPFGMNRSKLFRDEFNDDNVAEPHFVKDDGSTAALPRPDLSADTLMGPAGCLWSTVPDMLKWAKEYLYSISGLTESDPDDLILKEMQTNTAHQPQLAYQGLFENTYGFGWFRLSMPSPLYGFMSTNGVAESPLLGQVFERRLMLYHGGQVTGYLTTLCLFPETQSAIVVFSNTQVLGDASDWVARAIMQDLFELRPPIDLVSQARIKARDARQLYANLIEDYRAHKGAKADFEVLDDKFGKLSNDGLKLSLDIHSTSRGDKAGEFCLNGKETQRHYLEPFDGPILGFPPSSREELESRCTVDYISYEQLLLTFQRDKSGNHDSVTWIMQSGLSSIVFKRV